MSTMDRVLAKAGVYELRPIEDRPVILSATKFLIGHVLNTHIGEAGLLFALLNRSEQAFAPVIRGLKPSMNGRRGRPSAIPAAPSPADRSDQVSTQSNPDGKKR
ncbi:hypothetical protein RGR602_PC01810 (plasmid) [Rhizobium gallicum bv. gallicum R602sp]|uniref:Uncharacterized protein n=1 Tax=Rhizobium gallicum bv. gallicum R602sp TaxID=1041138 RepID=A0A0B4XCU5_9HYPH|nr:hypothetical protein RGR602_PC01810 [Rhizobium gallicum bv. gallicum R602sp]